MTKQKTITSLAAAISLSLAAMAPLATTAMAQQNTPQVYGSQLMTQQERFEHRQLLLNAETGKERERIRTEHHRKMQERAKEQGVTLPEQPPAQGMGKGQGQGSGPGAGQGRGMGQGGS